MHLAGAVALHNGTNGTPQFFKIGYSSLPGSHEADLPVELFLGAQPGDIARALGGVLPGDRVDVVLSDRAARRAIATTWAEQSPSVPCLARAIDYDGRDPGMLRLIDALYLNATNPTTAFTVKMIIALRAWRDEAGDLSWFTTSATEHLFSGAAKAGMPHMSWRCTDGVIEIEIDDATIGTDAVVVISTVMRVSILGPLTLVEEGRMLRTCVTWPPGEPIDGVDLIIRRQEAGH